MLADITSIARAPEATLLLSHVLPGSTTGLRSRRKQRQKQRASALIVDMDIQSLDAQTLAHLTQWRAAAQAGGEWGVHRLEWLYLAGCTRGSLDLMPQQSGRRQLLVLDLAAGAPFARVLRLALRGNSPADPPAELVTRGRPKGAEAPSVSATVSPDLGRECILKRKLAPRGQDWKQDKVTLEPTGEWPGKEHYTRKKTSAVDELAHAAFADPSSPADRFLREWSFSALADVVRGADSLAAAIQSASAGREALERRSSGALRNVRALPADVSAQSVRCAAVEKVLGTASRHVERLLQDPGAAPLRVRDQQVVWGAKRTSELRGAEREVVAMALRAALGDEGLGPSQPLLLRLVEGVLPAVLAAFARDEMTANARRAVVLLDDVHARLKAHADVYVQGAAWGLPLA